MRSRRSLVPWACVALFTIGCDQAAPPGTSSSGSASTARSAAPPAQSQEGSVAAAAGSGSASAPATLASAAPADKPADRARALVEEMGKGEWDAAAKRLPAKGGKAVDGATIKSWWEGSVQDKGAFVAIASVTPEPRGAKKLERVTVKLASGTMDVLVTFDGAGQLAALKLNHAKGSYLSPAYVDASKLESRPVMIGTGDSALPGTLTLPRGVAAAPVVILLNGSGPGDRDESNDAGSRPFKDLADGLASRGVAAIRFDKRTGDPLGVLSLGIPPADFTIEHEYLKDVAAAIALATSTQGIDPKRVYLAGHSMGAWLTPWLMELHPEVAGGILLAGNTRKFHELVIPQLEYMAKLDDGQVSPAEKAAIDAERPKYAKAGDPKLALDTPVSELPFNTGAKYWLSIVGYEAAKTAKKLSAPLFILQGGRDYQVTVKDDFEIWKKELSGRAKTKFSLYDKLNHNFIPGEGMATPAEYVSASGHVDVAVVDDIASWISAGG